MCLTEDRTPQRREEAQFTSAPGSERSWIDRNVMPSGDSAGFMSAFMSPMMGLEYAGTEFMGRPLAAAMRDNPALVHNVSGKPMMMLNGRPNAFSGVYGNKEPQNFTAMDAMQQIEKAPAWQGDIPFFKDDVSPAAAAVTASLQPAKFGPWRSAYARSQRRGEVIDRSGGTQGGAGNRTFSSGGASGYGGNDRTAVGPGGTLGHI